jgi:hypothetical protein
MSSTMMTAAGTREVGLGSGGLGSGAGEACLGRGGLASLGERVANPRIASARGNPIASGTVATMAACTLA